MESNFKSSLYLDDRLQTILNSYTECKLNYYREKEECKKLRENNIKLEIEIKEARELEKSHRYHLLNSREIIDNLQQTISELVYIKRDMKKIKDELLTKDSTISTMEKEKENLVAKHIENMAELRNKYENQIEELHNYNERNAQQLHQDTETQIAQFTCVIEELRAKMIEKEQESRDKMNVVVLEYEEKLQRSAAQITQLHDQHAGLIARTDANIDAYKRRLEDLEDRLKKSQFKQYLVQSTLPTQYESQVERPYSVDRGFDDSIDLDPVLEVPKKQTPVAAQNKGPKQNTLQVMYYENQPPPNPKTEKKGPFNITKKRKLYNEKDFQNF